MNLLALLVLHKPKCSRLDRIDVGAFAAVEISEGFANNAVIVITGMGDSHCLADAATDSAQHFI